MRKTILFLTFSLLLLSLPALADEWNKSYSVGAKPSLRVDTNDAAIEISGGVSNTIQARVTTDRYEIGSGGVRITEHQDGDNWNDEPPLEQHRKRAHVALAKPLEAALEPVVKARE